MAEPKLLNVSPLIAAGINPVTGLPLRCSTPYTLHEDIKKSLRVLDEQNAVNRFTWYNLPRGLNGQLIERVLYYRGQGMFFYIEETDKFYFLPYTLNTPDSGSGLDPYGRYVEVSPVQFNGGEDDKKKKLFIPGMKRKCEYDIIMPEELTLDIIKNSCVIIHDYTPQISQTVLQRQILNEPILSVMSEMFPMMRTALINETGVSGMRVNNQDDADQVYDANRQLLQNALSGEPLVPIVGTIDFQDLSHNGTGRAQDYLMAMQAIDNFRLGLYGLDSGGVFEKKSHTLESEQAMNASNTGLVMQDGLTNRQRSCDIINSIFGLGVWVEPSETTIGVDMNMDGKIEDDASNETNEQKEVYAEDEESV